MSHNLRRTDEWLKTHLQTRARAQAQSFVPASKYHNVKTNGYHSKRESDHASTLALLARSGQITDLVEQPKFLLIPKQGNLRACFYIGDFSYIDIEGRKRVIDVKGIKTDVYQIKKKLMRLVHGIDIEEV
jgi:hypothetical protein